MELGMDQLNAKLSLLFSTMEARKASLRREEEDRKLSRRRFWWQDQQTNEHAHNPKISHPTSQGNA